MKRPITGNITIVLFGLLLLAGCSRQPNLSLTVGAKANTEQMLLGEITAQHLEKKLGARVMRSFDVSTTTLAYQGLMMTNIDILPEDTTAIVATILKEAVDSDPSVGYERAKGELQRIAHIDVLPPLGIRHKFAMVVRAETANQRKIKTLSDAAKSEQGWSLAVTPEFQDRPDGFSALMGKYSLPLMIAARAVDPHQTYNALASKQVDMISGVDTDGPLAGPDYVVLADDQGALRESQTCLLVRQEQIDRFPGLRQALAELSGKFSNESIRKMNYDVGVAHHAVAQVVSEFLRKAGL